MGKWNSSSACVILCLMMSRRFNRLCDAVSMRVSGTIPKKKSSFAPAFFRACIARIANNACCLSIFGSTSKFKQWHAIYGTKETFCVTLHGSFQVFTQTSRVCAASPGCGPRASVISSMCVCVCFVISLYCLHVGVFARLVDVLFVFRFWAYLLCPGS